MEYGDTIADPTHLKEIQVESNQRAILVDVNLVPTENLRLSK